MIVGPLIPPDVLLVLLVVTAACVTTRWAAPLSLRWLAALLQGAMAVSAAVMILPEYYYSAMSRRDGRNPSQLAYDYGAAVGCLAMVLHKLVGFLLRGAASVIRAVPLPLVAVATAVLTIGQLVGLYVL